MKLKFYFLAVAVIMAAVFSGCKEKEEESVAPTVVTKNAYGITKTSATLKGEITNVGTEPITTCGFYYDTISSMNYPMVLESSLDGNVFVSTLSDINPSTTYYYRAYAVSNAGTAEGEIVRFSTVEAVAPSVSTMPASGVTLVGATLNGNVTEAGGDTIKERGFYYGLNEENMSLKVECGSSTGVYSKTLEGLTSATTYYFKAYAINADGTSYGEIESFTTSEPSAPEVMTMSATSITSNGATLNGKIVSNGTEPVTVKGFVYGTNESNLTQNVSSTSTSNNFTKEITGLSPSRTYYYKAYAINAIGTTYGEVSSFTTPALVAPTVQTMSATSITVNGATLNGKVASEGSASVTERGFVYGTNSNNLSNSVTSGTGAGSYNKSLTNLSSSTTYYYKAYATSSAGTSYGAIESFTTQATVAPTVLTVNASNVTVSGATLNGNVTAAGTSTVTARGFMYGTSATNLSQQVECGSGTGTFNKALTGLTASTTYYFKAYATSSAGTSYGAVESFTTQTPVAPTVQTMSTTSITQTGATLNGKVLSAGTYSVTSRGFVYGTSATSLTQNVESTSTTDNFSKALTGLTPSTTYYYKAYAINSVGTSYGEVTSFTTLAPVAPTVVTSDATDITMTGNATLNGSVTSDGCATVTASGFVYGTNQNNLTTNVSCGTGTGSMTYTLTGLTQGTTYYFKAYATNSVGTSYGEVKSFSTPCQINGHEYVDLGLPSGKLWATCNVGASSPTAAGGEYQYTTVTWGGGWIMPTRVDIQELIGSCSYVRTTENSVSGYRFTGPNGNTIFMPNGYYWSSTTAGTGSYYYLELYSNGSPNVNNSHSSSSYYYKIRPVHPAQNK
ncbi:MAG: hypothetical protein IKK36_01555 [Bacteroidales bacterium]|nr:hypothetical protein [Bacteroidales bacterium]